MLKLDFHRPIPNGGRTRRLPFPLGFDYRTSNLVIVGALPDGRKEAVALEAGYLESVESWAGVL